MKQEDSLPFAKEPVTYCQYFVKQEGSLPFAKEPVTYCQYFMKQEGSLPLAKEPVTYCQYFMKQEGSLPLAKEPVTWTYPEPDQSTPRPWHPPFRICRRAGFCAVSCNVFKFLSWGFVTTSPNLQTEEPPFVSCSPLIIKYMGGYPL